MLDGFGFLREWLTSLVAIVMFASFVELLLPDSSLGKHVKMVLGFTVVLFLVKPFVGVDVPKLMAGSTLERLGLLSEAQQSRTTQSTQQVIARGQTLAQSTAGVLQAEQLDAAARQLEATLELIGGVSQAKVVVTATSSGAIERVSVTIALPKDQPKGAASDVRERLRRYVATALNTDVGLVEVHEKGVR